MSRKSKKSRSQIKWSIESWESVVSLEIPEIKKSLESLENQVKKV